MFTDIKAEAINIEVENWPIASGVPDFHELNAINSVWRMILWVYDSFIQDCEFYKTLNIPERWKSEPIELTDWKMRNVERTISYINLTSVLDGILAQLYERIHKVDKKYFPEPHISYSSPRKHHEEDFRLVKFYRNKVTAHTAYANPRKEDSWSRQITSLVHVSGGIVFPSKPELFCIGGVQLIAKGDDPTGFTDSFSIYKEHPKLKKYFSAWAETITNGLKHLADQCPIEKKSVAKISKGTAWQEL